MAPEKAASMLRLFALIVWYISIWDGDSSRHAFGTSGIVAMIHCLILSAVVMPLGEFAAGTSTAALDHLAGAGISGDGIFSSLLILTLLRDMVLLAGFAANDWLMTQRGCGMCIAGVRSRFPALSRIVTSLGFVNARRLPRFEMSTFPLRYCRRGCMDQHVQISRCPFGATIKEWLC